MKKITSPRDGVGADPCVRPDAGNKAQFLPPFPKGGKGEFYKRPKIPLNPPFSKGDFLRGTSGYEVC